ncbi:universal stress protein [Roseovarius sp. S1116L3]|uniref:universal stress protein n=1 Tax=Roseovarius roseus TaxID=3342636 RepID=UPI00372CD4AF
MTKKIIALVDGSTYSKSVCDHAVWIAERSGYEVELMHVLGRREGGGGSDLSGAISLGARSALLAELASIDEQRAKLVVHRGRAILEDAKALFDEAGFRATEHLRHGDLIEAIFEKEGGAEMILIGKRGEAADFAKGHLGSNLERIVRAASKPLFIASRAFQPIEKVLIAYDGSASAIRTVDYVSRAPLYAKLDIKIVTVGSATETARNGLEDAKAMLAAAGLKAETGILPGQPEEVIGKLVEKAEFDHLVMGASGHSRLRSLFVGSTSLEMIRSCKVPILLVR